MTYFSEILIFVGAIVMMLSIIKTRYLMNMLGSPDMKRRWRLLLALMTIFLFGYLVAGVVMLSPLRGYFLVLTGAIFLGGAIFVYLVVSTGYFTVSELEGRVSERSHELSAALKSLQKTADAQIETNAELRRTLKLNEGFIANTSHELRTPLNAILGIVEVLKLGLYGELNEKQVISIDSIESSGRHLLQLLNDILDLRKITTDHLDLEVESIDIWSVCQEVVLNLDGEMRSKDISCQLFESADVGAAELDKRRFRQIIYNLLGNAIKFSPRGGQVGIRYFDCPGEDLFRIVVWDKGDGISLDDQKELFKPFSQLDNRLSKKYEGTGLGLALVKSIAEVHGGFCGVESTPGEGSQFSVTLPRFRTDMKLMGNQPESTEGSKENSIARVPISQKQPAPVHQTQILSQRLKEVSILLVDDIPLNLKHVTVFLKHQGASVMEAFSGEEALGKILEKRPEIVLLDIQMPEMDGLEVISRVREDERIRDTKIIAATALAMKGDRDRFFRAGANGYLSKPFTMGKLEEEIANVLRLSS